MGGVCSAQSNKKKLQSKNVSANTEAKNSIGEENQLNNMKIEDKKIENEPSNIL